MKGASYSGVVSAPVVPMLEGGAIDWDCLREYSAWLVAQRPVGIAVNMDAGEGHSLSRDERRAILQTYVASANSSCKVIAGIIASTTAEAVDLGLEAKSIGADAMVLFPPLPLFLGDPLPHELPLRFHQDVADRVGLPLIVFLFPAEVGPAYGDALIASLARITEVVAAKEATFSTARFLEIKEVMCGLNDPPAVLTGADNMLFEQMLLGADGALIGFASILTDELVKMHAAVGRGDLAAAQRDWNRIGPLARYAWRPPMRDYRPRMKELLVAQGLFRSSAVRAPLLRVSELERKRLRELAVQAGVPM